ncbi:MAG: cadherin-like domain-containing protein, partial [Acidobacteriota bacterium]
DIDWWENETIHRSATFPEGTTVDGAFNGAHDITAVDLDGDGDLDLVGAAQLANDITWWDNTTSDGSTWIQRTIDANFRGAISVKAVDMDGDGDLDVLGAAEVDNDISWWENTGGDGSAWTERVVDSNFNDARSVYAADLDGDGDLDVIGASFNVADIAWWENTAGDGTAWSKTLIDGSFSGAHSVFAADVDGDGDLDILGAARDANDISWWENTAGDASAWTERSVDNNFSGARSVFAADLDGDGDLDVLGAGEFADDIAWWENTAGNGSSWSKRTIEGSFDRPFAVRAADLDGDGDLDVLGAARNADDITWWENTAGDATAWTEHTVDGSFDGAVAVAAADVDSDGDLDILGAALVADDVAWWPNRGGQFALPTGDVAPARAADGATVAALKIDLQHRGRTGDQAIELTTVEVLLEDGAATPLDSAQANALLESLAIYLDDGSGAFEIGSDSVVSTVDTLSLTDGVLTIAVGGPDFTLPLGAARTLFVVASFDASASAAVSDELRLTHLTESSSTAVDDDHDIPLTLEYSSDTPSSLVEVNDLPVAVDDAVAGLEDAQIVGNLLDGSAGGLDTDEEGDALTAVLVSGPTQGTLVGGLAANGGFTYEPSADWNGADSFTYAASDGAGVGNMATVTITVNAVNDLPVAVDDAVTGLEDTQIAGNVLDGSAGGLDSDVDGDGLSAVLISGPSHGSLVGGLSANGDFTYEPEADFNGVDSFTYAATDGTGNGNTATVTVTLAAVNDAPSFTLAAVAEADQDLGPQSFPGFASALSPGPADEATQGQTFEVTANSNPTLFSDAPAFTGDGTLNFTLASTDVGSAATVTVRLMDDGGTADGGVDVSPTQDFEIEVIDSVAPEITALASSGGVIEGCSELRSATASLVVTFSEAMANPAGDTAPEDITNPANFQLVGSGPDGDFTTLGCDALADDDVLLTPTGVTYDGLSFEATAALSPALGDGVYRLFVCDALQDVGGNALLADAAVTFRQSASNPLSNSHFDCDLDGWTTVSTVSGEIEWSAEDANDAGVSGSVRIADLTGGALTIGQCVDLDPTRVGAQVRVDGPLDAGVNVMTTCEGFAGPSCSGASLGSQTETNVVLHTAGAWLPLTAVLANQGASSALCSFDLTRVSGTNFEAYLDEISVSDVLFGDGFESGDTSAWSALVQ